MTKVLGILCGLLLFSGCGGGGNSASTPLLSRTVTNLVVTASAHATTGSPFSFTVTAVDASNTTVSNYAGTIHFTSTDSRAVLPGNSTLVNGTATFSATLETAGNQTLTATDISTPSITGTSSSISVSGASSSASATIWYVNGVSGSDNNNCLSATTACKTIAHAIAQAASGDTIRVAAAIYVENLNIGKSLTITGAGTSTTVVDGGGVTTVVTISSGTATVSLSELTIRNGRSCAGGGISNIGVLTVNESTISGNRVFQSGICDSLGAGLANAGKATISNSTISGNSATGTYGPRGGGILNWRMGSLTVNNSTITGNMLSQSGTFAGTKGGAIFNFEGGTVRIISSTISGNGAELGGNLYNIDGTVTIQNSIVANSSAGGNCNGIMTSDGYNLSSDSSCTFSNTGDRNNTNPQLGPLQNNGGPTPTMALPSGSPAVDAGNPTGCRDSSGNLLTTDQRGAQRPDTEDGGRGCDIGAFERQSD